MKSYLEVLFFPKTTTCLLKVILLTFLIFPLNFIHGQLFSQVPTLEWEKRYYGTDIQNNYPIAMVVDSSGNSYITGGVTILNENSNIVTIKYNSAGVQQWIDIYNGPGSNSIDMPIGIQLDKFRNIYVCGHSELTGFGTDDYVTIKYDTNGTRLWVSRYNSQGSFSDKPYSMTIDESGNVYVTGISYNGTRNDALTIKYDTNGDSVWVRRFNPASVNTLGSSVVTDVSGNAYVTVQSGFTLMLVKYNSLGVQQWAASGTNCYNMKSVIDNSGNVYIGGTTSQGMPLSSDFYLCKYNTLGTQLWSKSYNGPINGNEGLKSMFVKNGNIFITGYSPGSGSLQDIVTIYYNNSNGDTIWIRRYNGTGNGYDQPFAITADNLGNVYITGESENISGADITTIKYTASGAFQWELRYSGAGNDIKLNPITNDIFVFGSTRDVFSNGELITIKYDPLVGITNHQNLLPDSYKLYQNYPNPFNPQTKMKYQIINGGNVKLNIFDITGKLIKTLINQSQNSGSYEAEWNAEKFASGIYFYSLITEEYTETKRMVLIK